jgi:hypothetical protein
MQLRASEHEVRCRLANFSTVSKQPYVFRFCVFVSFLYAVSQHFNANAVAICAIAQALLDILRHLNYMH